MLANKLSNLFVILVLLVVVEISQSHYEPTWESLDARPLPSWYDESKIGIFFHWGVYSVPSFETEWFWYQWKSRKDEKCIKFMKDQYPPSFTYQDFARDFDAYMFDPDWWAKLIEDSGAKYMIFTSKHHEGYCNWPSNVSFSWNSMDVGPKKDLVGLLANSIRNLSSEIHFGLYHSLFEWFNPLYLKDKANNFSTQYFVESKTLPELYELVNTYKPELIWSDGEWEAPDTYWKSKEFLTWLYNDSPVKDSIVVNDRWGKDDKCKHGGYWTCDDQFNPKHLMPHKFENDFILDKQSWGYRREAVLGDYLTDLQVITTLAETISCGGNAVLNIGPRKDGTIDPLMEERLRNMGKWLRVNGEAIYGSKPWIHQNETNVPVWYTSKKNSVYAIVLKWPAGNLLTLANITPSPGMTVKMLGYNRSPLNWKLSSQPPGVAIDFSGISFGQLPSTVAWVLKFQNNSFSSPV